MENEPSLLATLLGNFLGLWAPILLMIAVFIFMTKRTAGTAKRNLMTVQEEMLENHKDLLGVQNDLLKVQRDMNEQYKVANNHLASIATAIEKKSG